MATGQIIEGVIKGLFGTGQMISGAVKNKQAKKLVPPEIDNTQVDMLDNMRRLRMGYQTGSEASQYKNLIGQGLANSINASIAAGGGNTGATLAAIGNAQASAQGAYNSVVAALEKNRLAALQMEDTQVDQIAQRKLDIQMAKYLQKLGEAKDDQKRGQENMMSGLSDIAMGVAGGGEGESGSTTQTKFASID